MKNINNIIRKELQNFAPYSSARTEAKSGNIWLNANESGSAQSYASQFNDLNRYPSQQPNELVNELANFYDSRSNQLLITRGSDEAIDLLFRLCCTPQQDKVIVCNPTFGMYEIGAKLQGVEVINIPLITDNYELNLPAIKSSLSAQVKLLFLCSPNNPIGNILKKEDITELCTATMGKSLVVVDEAYIEFASVESLISKIDEYPNLVVLRTLSKAFGLAGIRVGCLIASYEITASAKKILPPYPLPTPCIAIALSKLDSNNVSKMLDRVEKIKKARESMKKKLSKLAIVKKIWRSEANFLLIEFMQNIKDKLIESGIVIRDMQTKLNKKNIYRVTIGLAEENSQFIKLIESIEVSYENM